MARRPHGGPSNTTIGKIEGGIWRPTRGVGDTLEKLDHGLGWAKGSSANVLRGGEPLERDAEKAPAAKDRGDEPVIVHATRVAWRSVNDLAQSPDGDQQRPEKARRAVLVTADVLTDVLLSVNAGPAAKSLIQEMSHRAYELIQEAKEQNSARRSPSECALHALHARSLLVGPSLALLPCGQQCLKS